MIISQFISKVEHNNEGLQHVEAYTSYDIYTTESK